MTLAIDIGSNTSKCLLAGVSGGKIEKRFELSIENRISAGAGALVPNAAAMIANAVEIFTAKAKNFSGEFQTLAVATSALRECPYGAEVAREVSGLAGVDLQILSGWEEARLSYLGALSDPMIPRAGFTAYFDLGGGSLEIVFGRGSEVESAHSLPVGAVVLKERFCASEKISESARAQIFGFVASALERVAAAPGAALVGAGGAVAAARLMNAKISGADSNEISVAQIENFINILSEMSVAERAGKFGMAKSRADIIVPALVCIQALARKLGARALLHTFCNLRYGMLLDAAARRKNSA